MPVCYFCAFQWLPVTAQTLVYIAHKMYTFINSLQLQPLD